MRDEEMWARILAALARDDERQHTRGPELHPPTCIHVEEYIDQALCVLYGTTSPAILN